MKFPALFLIEFVQRRFFFSILIPVLFLIGTFFLTCTFLNISTRVLN